MKRLLSFVFTLSAALALAVAFVTPLYAAEAGEPVTLTAEQWMQVQSYLSQQSQEISQQSAEKFYWFDAYTELKQCIRESVKNGTPANVCIGDLEV